VGAKVIKQIRANKLGKKNDVIGRAKKWLYTPFLLFIAQALPGKAECVGCSKLLFLISCSNWQVFTL
jgi:hypothetical protein